MSVQLALLLSPLMDTSKLSVGFVHNHDLRLVLYILLTTKWNTPMGVKRRLMINEKEIIIKGKKYKNGSNSLLSTVKHVLYYAGESPTVCLVEIDSLLFRFNNSLRASSLWLWRRGGNRKGSLQLQLWNLNICIKKVIVMTSLPLAHVFQCFFTFTLVSASCWLAEIWQLSRGGATGELEVERKFQRCSCKLSFLFPPCCQSAPESLLAG